MNTNDLAESVHAFETAFKTQIMLQIDELNAIGDGALQDGYNSTFIDDGWVSLKGYSWGFVMHYDEPVRIDMTFGPDWPFVGYRTTFIAQRVGDRIAWVNEQRPTEICYDAQQLARFALRKLACKAGDDRLVDSKYAAQIAEMTGSDSIAENI